MDIGTAKPSKAMQEKHPHISIDVVDPDEQFDVTQFIQLADEALEEAQGSGQPCMIMGGTGFYIRHFLFGLPHNDPVDPNIRERIQQRLEEEGNEKLHAYLQRVDPPSAQKIHVNDTYRITRALEIYEQTGRPRSDFSMYSEEREVPPHEFVGLYCDKQVLAERIASRVDTMFQTGLVEEVKTLKNKGYSLQHRAMHCIGYKEFLTSEELQDTSHNSSSFDTIKDTIVQRTIRFAKRQRVFFKQFASVTWYELTEKDKLLSHMDRLLQ